MRVTTFQVLVEMDPRSASLFFITAFGLFFSVLLTVADNRDGLAVSNLASNGTVHSADHTVLCVFLTPTIESATCAIGGPPTLSRTPTVTE